MRHNLPILWRCVSRVEDISTENVETFYLLDFAGPQGFAVELAKRAQQ